MKASVLNINHENIHACIIFRLKINLVNIEAFIWYIYPKINNNFFRFFDGLTSIASTSSTDHKNILLCPFFGMVSIYCYEYISCYQEMSFYTVILAEWSKAPLSPCSKFIYIGVSSNPTLHNFSNLRFLINSIILRFMYHEKVNMMTQLFLRIYF